VCAKILRYKVVPFQSLPNIRRKIENCVWNTQWRAIKEREKSIEWFLDETAGWNFFHKKHAAIKFQ
jgi:hypothetical protein